jgi:6-phosphogluconolactonase
MKSAKILFAASLIIVVGLAMSLAGCTSGCAPATPGSASGASGGTGGGSTPPASGCSLPGSSGSTGKAAAYAYYVNTGTIGAAILDTSGNFVPIPNFVSPPGSLSAVGGVVTAQKKWLYVSRGTTIEAYSINSSTGAITALTGSPFPTSDTEAYGLSTDPSGKFLFQSAANDNQVTVFAINQTDGTLTPVGSFGLGFFAAQATTDGLGKYLYVTAGNLGSEVAIFSIGPTGFLTPIAGSPFSISIAQFRSEPSGAFLIGITGNGANNGFPSDNHVYVFAINQSTGALSPVNGSPFATTFTPGTFAVDPNGTLIYTFNQTVTGSSPMEGFQLDTTSGALTPLTISPFTSMTASDGMFDQSGAFLFLYSSSTLAVASVDSTTGALTSIGSPVTSVGPSTSWTATDPQ